MERNIRNMAEYCRRHGIALWPHTKTHKTPEIARLQLNAGARGLTVAKVGEAEVMVDAGFRDILVAYPVVGEAKTRRLAALARRASMTVATDSVEAGLGISNAAQWAGVTLQVLVEFNARFDRVGAADPAGALGIAREVAALPGLDFAGLFYYPGQFFDLPSEEDLRPVADLLSRTLRLFDEAGLHCRRVSGGSTPTAYSSHLLPGTTEIRPGTYVFFDRNGAEGGLCAYRDCAASVLATVVSTAVPGRAVVDAGSKALAADPLATGDHAGFGHVFEYPEIGVVRLSEEHGWLGLPPTGAHPRIGERVRIVPNHICPAVNLYDRIYGYRGERMEVEWQVAARGRLQ